MLDAGCGGGAHAQSLIERGAVATGIDKSAGVLATARERLGDQAHLVQAELGQTLPFESGSFDLILAALVMNYLEDRSQPLVEFHRLLLHRTPERAATGFQGARSFPEAYRSLTTKPRLLGNKAVKRVGRPARH